MAHETEEHLRHRGAKRRPRQTGTIWAYYGERSETVMSRILSMVHATHSITREVLTRRQFKETIEAHLTGPFLELIESKLAMLNGRKTEARRLRQQVEDEIEWLLPMWLLHPVEGDFDRKRAAIEALNNLRAEEAQNRRLAEKLLRNKVKARRIRRLPKNAVEEFFSWVEFVIGFTLSKEEGLRMFEELRRKPATKSGRSRRKTSA